MARAGRLAGALLVEAGGAYYLVGNLKEPCDWRGHGFLDPGEIDAVARPWRPLQVHTTPRVNGPYLCFTLENETLASLLAERLVIRRNGSVTERLWRLLWESAEGQADLPAQWLLEIPAKLWEIVRETVLRCS